MKMEKDVLEEIPDEDLPLLSDLYRNHQAEAPHVHSLINTAIAWKKKKPNSNYLTFYGIDGDWSKSGTFILLMQYSCYDLFVYTLEKDCEKLYKGLVETGRIDWKKKVLFFAVSAKHTPTVIKVLEELKPSSYRTIPNELWVMDREEALQFEIECPEDVYMGKLNRSHVPLINGVWPHRYDGSEDYLSTFVEMNNSFGLFSKSDGSLVSWVLKNQLGQLAILQTVAEHKRKGYAMVMVKAASKEIAVEGHNPLGTVVRGNVASERMFARLGFRSIDVCTYFLTS